MPTCSSVEIEITVRDAALRIGDTLVGERHDVELVEERIQPVEKLGVIQR